MEKNIKTLIVDYEVDNAISIKNALLKFNNKFSFNEEDIKIHMIYTNFLLNQNQVQTPKELLFELKQKLYYVDLLILNLDFGVWNQKTKLFDNYEILNSKEISLPHTIVLTEHESFPYIHNINKSVDILIKPSSKTLNGYYNKFFVELKLFDRI